MTENFIEIMQGDSVTIPFSVIDADGNKIQKSDLKEAELTIGTLTDRPKTVIRRTLSAGTIAYDDVSGDFSFNLSQEDTFSLVQRKYKVDLRIMPSGSDKVEGIELGEIHITLTVSKEVLK